MRESKTRAISARQTGYMYFLKEFDARYQESLVKWVRQKRPTAGTILLTLLSQTQVGAVNPLLGKWMDLDERSLDEIPQGVWKFLHDHWGKMSHGSTSWRPIHTWETVHAPVPFEFEGLPTVEEIGKAWLTTTEAADILGINPDGVRVRARKGLLERIPKNRSHHGKGGGRAMAMFSTESVVASIRSNPPPKWRKILRGESAA